MIKFVILFIVRVVTLIRKLLGRAPSVKRGQTTLVTIPFSHYVERARFALQYGKIEHKELASPPVLHMFETLPLSGYRKSSVPLLILPDGRQLQNSGKIMEHVAQEVPSLDLYPAEHKAIIDDIEMKCDKVIGHNARLVLYSSLFATAAGRAAVVSLFTRNVSPVKALLVRLLFPLISGMMVKSMKLSPTTARHAAIKLKPVLDEIEHLLSDNRKFLCGTDKPTAADITFATIAYPLFQPAQLDPLVGTLRGKFDIKLEPSYNGSGSVAMFQVRHHRQLIFVFAATNVARSLLTVFTLCVLQSRSLSNFKQIPCYVVILRGQNSKIDCASRDTARC